MAITLLLGAGYLWSPLLGIGQGALLLFVLLVLFDICCLYRVHGVEAVRVCSDRFSNGDDNEVKICLRSHYSYLVRVEVIDEIPFVFQKRDVCFETTLKGHGKKELLYTLCPTRRGNFRFGRIQVFVYGRAGLILRRYSCGESQEIKVYPSYLMLKRYELLAVSSHLVEMGVKRIRRVGLHSDFEQIKEYVTGDDFRTINWKASARRHQLMTNAFQDERAQQVYCLIDKGRMMQQAFRGMTLLDYAINASLVLSYVALQRGDKAGLVTFAERVDSFVSSSNRTGQMRTLLESLYAQQTTFGETDFSALAVALDHRINKHSFLILYTNFSNLGSLNRQLAYFRQISRRHRVLVVIFEDMELDSYLTSPPKDTEEYYQHVIGEKFELEKRTIVSTLRQHGISALLTTPAHLSIDVINKYLEMKARQSL